MAAPLPMEEAQARLIALAPALPHEHAGVEDALGRYLAAPLTALRRQPAADLSAMDGYALAADDLAGPWQVVGESAAGHPFAGRVAAGQAVRISTGALLPDGAGVVLLQEDCTREGDMLRLTGTPPTPQDRHIRRAGFDFSTGTAVLNAGTGIGPAQVALAIAAGHAHVPVRRRARVAIIDSGDELSAIGTPCAAHQIPASNGAMLAALLPAAACHIARHGPVPDRLDALVGALEACAGADLILTSGGASVGDHDLIRPALEAWGATIDFWKVAIRPGKPLLVARKGDTMVIGLPGNPVSSMVTAHLFALPVLRAMLGAAAPLPVTVRLPVAQDLAPGGQRREFRRGFWDGTQVWPNPMRDSSALAAMAASNCLIDCPADGPAVAAGQQVNVVLTNITTLV
ncbi:molybdopterin molybdenumtransferase MoeA [Novosphingobium sp. FSY-8]|uniref:Molybdopterin molybdenumtransferase n=1 Tax=Novosphingobium ovatum TaxID=1908523 RepID=A0ABW9XC73_9SPHN|nr:molybdopterin molybdotransferase MoeA [Novosphingobium ovatum]NBC36125.1 molybdopterin molybdenumtransferase MoeA [Novosphingobium ovatum]